VYCGRFPLCGPRFHGTMVEVMPASRAHRRDCIATIFAIADRTPPMFPPSFEAASTATFDTAAVCFFRTISAVSIRCASARASVFLAASLRLLRGSTPCRIGSGSAETGRSMIAHGAPRSGFRGVHAGVDPCTRSRTAHAFVSSKPSRAIPTRPRRGSIHEGIGAPSQGDSVGDRRGIADGAAIRSSRYVSRPLRAEHRRALLCA
jgi:hypothetical protein